MNKSLRAGAVIAALVIAGRAAATDLAAPVYAVPEVSIGWSGFYVGVNLGGTWSSTQGA